MNRIARRIALLLLLPLAAGCSSSNQADRQDGGPTAASESPPSEKNVAKQTMPGKDPLEQKAVKEASRVDGHVVVMLSPMEAVGRNVRTEELADFHKKIDAAVEAEFGSSPAKFEMQVDYLLRPNGKPQYVVRHDGKAPQEQCRSLLARLSRIDQLNSESEPIRLRGGYRIGASDEKPDPRRALTPLAVVGAASQESPESRQMQKLRDDSNQKLQASLERSAKQRNDQAARPMKHGYKDLKSPAEELTRARKYGWSMVQEITRNMIAADHAQFPGVRAWLNDYSAAAKKVNTTSGPNLDLLRVEELVTRNHRFWEAHFEIVPGDEMWCLLHSALLLAGGEAKRSLYVTHVGMHCRKAAEQPSSFLSSIANADQRLLMAVDSPLRTAIQLFDKGKHEEAARIFVKSLKDWPGDGMAAYELGLTRFHQSEIAAGREPPALGQVRTTGDIKLPAETIKLYARARFHDPFLTNAYQGRDPKRIKALLALHRLGGPALNRMTHSTTPVAPQTLMVFAAVMQACQAYDLSSVGLWAVVSRRQPLRPYNSSDLKFLGENLAGLVGQKKAKPIIDKLAKKPLKLLPLSNKPK